MKLANHFIKALSAAACLLCLAAMPSCIQDNPDAPVAVTPGDEDVRMVNLSIRVPGASNATRALEDSDDECEVSEVDVLQFKGGKFAFRAIGYNISAGSGGKSTFSAKLLVGNYDLVVIANARGAVNNASNGSGGVTAWDGETATQDALDKLAISVTAANKITASGVLPRLPMFGILKGAEVDKELDLTGAGAISLVRMLSKIEVELTPLAASGVAEGSGNANFKLVDARLYNQALEGWVAPKVLDWPANNTVVAGYFGGVKSAPSKASYTASTPDQPVLYSGEADNVTDSNILNSIYTFEAPAGSEEGRDTNVCLVVGGYYNGATGSDLSYYRVDIREKGGDYLPLLRNHNYTVNVLTVTGPGYPTPPDAFFGTARLDAEIVPWNQAAEKTIIDGQWFLKVDEDLIELKGSGKVKSLDAETNYNISDRGFPAGLQVKDAEIVYVSGGTGWLTLVDVEGANGSLERTIGVKAPVYIGTSHEDRTRTAKVLVHAGNMTKVIDVTQSIAGVLASPGVIGYTEDTHELTLRGSEEYKANPDIAAAAEEMFPGQGLHEQTVYVAYFRFGSLVAIGSEPGSAGLAFSADNVIWVPEEYNDATYGSGIAGLKAQIAAWTAIEPYAGVIPAGSSWEPMNPENGRGNPCALMTEGGGNWTIPSDEIATGNWNGGTFGSTPITDTPDWSFTSGAKWVTANAGTNNLPISGAVAGNGNGNPDWSMFLPLTGERAFGSGERTRLMYLTFGRYWSSIGKENHGSGYPLVFTANSVSPGNSWSYLGTGAAIRCVKDPAATATFTVELVSPDDAVAYSGGDKTINVTSHLGEEPVAWTVTRVRYSEDGKAVGAADKTWTTDDGSRFGFVAGGVGGTTAAPYIATVAPQTASASTNQQDIDLKSTTVSPTKGAVGSRWNLAGNKATGGAVGDVIDETANSYVVNAPGYYKLPLVYGNALHNGGQPNGAAYAASNFVNHETTPTHITSPYINTMVSGKKNAVIIWQDWPGLVSNVAIDGNGEGDYLTFDVDRETIAQGNAVVAVRLGETILWSWHIWVTSLDLDVIPVTNQTTTYTLTASVYNFLNYNLGWVTKRDGIKFGNDKARHIEVTFTQAGGKTVTRYITQNPGSLDGINGNNPHWQWGRKDPMPPKVLKAGDDAAAAGVYYGTGYDYDTSAEQATLGGAIQNPHRFYSVAYNWNSTDHHNLWDADNPNTSAGYGSGTLNDNVTVKTVYDPNPVGYKMPPSNAWTGFTSSGQNTYATTGFNTSGAFVKGWNFYIDGWRTGATTFYTASGFRDNSSGAVGGVDSNGYYWSALPFSTTYGYNLYFFAFNVSPASNSRRSLGFSVRPVKDEDAKAAPLTVKITSVTNSPARTSRPVMADVTYTAVTDKTPPADATYQWYVSADGVTWTTVAGVTGNTYTKEVVSDVNYVRATITAYGTTGAPVANNLVTGIEYVHAAPGVLGIRESDIGKDPSEFSLTLKGSSIYSEPDGDYNPWDFEIFTQEFGPLEEEPVYAVYFKWGSTVAMLGGSIGTRGDPYDRSDVVWWGPGFDPSVITDTWPGGFTPAPETLGTLGTENNVYVDPATGAKKGHGDPCLYANDGAYPGYLTPTGRPWYNGEPMNAYAWVDIIPISYSENIANGGVYYLDLTNGIFIFMPAAGYRGFGDGVASEPGIDGSYWSTTAWVPRPEQDPNHTEPTGLGFRNNWNGLGLYDGNDYNDAFTIRCVYNLY